ncbi:MAG: HIT domain-containing protein [Deltaproteobacteria bacterium]|nr:HIT domain-containing protein [Deltaproteobacteria bacterium]
MDVLWAPWRMEFLRAPRVPGCVLCGLVAAEAEGTDRERLVLWRGRSVYCVMNLYPYNAGHVMLVPNQHVADLATLSREAQGELIWLVGETVRIHREVLQSEGANCGMNIEKAGGAGFPDHLHFHVVPRWQGDTNFFPVLAQSKSMPECLDQTYAQLQPAFAALSPHGAGC